MRIFEQRVHDLSSIVSLTKTNSWTGPGYRMQYDPRL